MPGLTALERTFLNSSLAGQIVVDAAFPGGNIVVEKIENDRVFLHQDLRDSSTDWFYWYFRIRGAEGRTLHFDFTRSAAIGVRGPAVSTDGGGTWNWIGAGAVEGNGFRFRFPKDPGEFRFSFGMPYQQGDWEGFYRRRGTELGLERHVLCRTRRGRELPFYLLKTGGAPVRGKVVISCRHHACEMMTNYVLEGILEGIMESAGPLQGSEFFIVPFVDLDGVEEGDQGKFRSPRDHNRDYTDSIYPETAAMMERIAEWQGGSPISCLDLHCPHIRGGSNEAVYLVGSLNPAMAREQLKFGEILELVNRSSLPFRNEDYVPFGTSWNVAESYRQGTSFTAWSAGLPKAALVSSVEIPYASARGAEVNAASCRDFGRYFAKAMGEYFQGRGNESRGGRFLKRKKE